MHNRWTS